MMSNYYKSGSDVCFRRLSQEYEKQKKTSTDIMTYDNNTSIVGNSNVHVNTIPESSFYDITKPFFNKTDSFTKNL